MQLVVDADVVVAEALRKRGRALMAHASLDLFSASEAWSEAQHELGRRTGQIARQRLLTGSEADQFLSTALTAVADVLVVVPATVYAERLEEAVARLPRDPNDAPTLALARALDCGVWTNDRDFFGCGVPVWSTDVLLWYVTTAPQSPPDAGLPEEAL